MCRCWIFLWEVFNIKCMLVVASTSVLYCIAFTYLSNLQTCSIVHILYNILLKVMLLKCNSCVSLLTSSLFIASLLNLKLHCFTHEHTHTHTHIHHLRCAPLHTVHIADMCRFKANFSINRSWRYMHIVTFIFCTIQIHLLTYTDL